MPGSPVCLHRSGRPSPGLLQRIVSHRVACGRISESIWCPAMLSMPAFSMPVLAFSLMWGTF